MKIGFKTSRQWFLKSKRLTLTLVIFFLSLLVLTGVTTVHATSATKKVTNTLSHSTANDIVEKTSNFFIPRKEASIKITGSHVQHDPVSIVGDNQLVAMAQAEGWPGDGSASNPYVIEGYYITANGSFTGYTGSYALGLVDTTKYVVIRNNIFNSSITSASVGVYLQGVKNIVVENNIFEDTLTNGVDLLESMAITVTNNSFQAVQFSGVYTVEVNQTTISGNTFANSTIRVDTATSDVIIDNNVFQNVYSTSYGRVSISIGGSGGAFNKNLRITNNYFDNIAETITMTNVTNILIQNNTFIRMRTYVISVSEVAGATVTNRLITITNNTFANSAMNGAVTINVRGLQDSMIDNNVFNNITMGGVLLEKSTNVTISHNLFQKMSTNTGSASIIDISLGSTNIVIMDNIIKSSKARTAIYVSDSNANQIVRNDLNGSNPNLSSGKGIDTGIEIRDGSIGNVVTNNTVSNMNGYGISLGPDVFNTVVRWNDFIDNNVPPAPNSGYSQARDDSPATANNSFIFNYWNEWTTPDNNSDGIVDEPYKIESQGVAGGWKLDPFPLAKPHGFPYTPPTNTNVPTIATSSGGGVPTPWPPIYILVLPLALLGVMRALTKRKR